jgi:predicted CXXCH cytochrome family protein
LKRFWFVAFSEQEMYRLGQENHQAFWPAAPRAHDGRYWGDGTPLTTALEYQGMALSACYANGKGAMTCLTCHSMHQADPNHQVKEGMRGNDACYQCHAQYRTKLAEHTHHAADSHGSQCMNCHMPHQVYSLLDTHRSHRISIPRVKDSLGTGKPHACNLCHLDKSLGWTQEQLGKWYKTPPISLPEEEKLWASSLLHLARSDARTRALIAGVFAWKPAQETIGRDWPAAVLLHTLEQDRYEAVRYSAHKALRSLYGKAAEDYFYQASPAIRAVKLQHLRQSLKTNTRLDPVAYPYLPISSAGHLAEEQFHSWFKGRNDPDVYINE